MPGPAAVSLVEASDGISTSKLVCKICKLYFEAKARCMCLSGNGEPKIERKPPKWMVKIMENPIKMDDLGGFPTIFGNTQYVDSILVVCLHLDGTYSYIFSMIFHHSILFRAH